MDLLGYLASGLNLISMTMKDLRLLRALSLVANGLFVIYGLMLHAYPIVVSCSIAVLIHAYQLHRITRLSATQAGHAMTHTCS